MSDHHSHPSIHVIAAICAFILASPAVHAIRPSGLVEHETARNKENISVVSMDILSKQSGDTDKQQFVPKIRDAGRKQHVPSNASKASLPAIHFGGEKQHPYPGGAFNKFEDADEREMQRRVVITDFSPTEITTRDAVMLEKVAGFQSLNATLQRTLRGYRPRCYPWRSQPCECATEHGQRICLRLLRNPLTSFIHNQYDGFHKCALKEIQYAECHFHHRDPEKWQQWRRSYQCRVAMHMGLFALGKGACVYGLTLLAPLTGGMTTIVAGFVCNQGTNIGQMQAGKRGSAGAVCERAGFVNPVPAQYRAWPNQQCAQSDFAEEHQEMQAVEGAYLSVCQDVADGSKARNRLHLFRTRDADCECPYGQHLETTEEGWEELCVGRVFNAASLRNEGVTSDRCKCTEGADDNPCDDVVTGSIRNTARLTWRDCMCPEGLVVGPQGQCDSAWEGYSTFKSEEIHAEMVGEDECTCIDPDEEDDEEDDEDEEAILQGISSCS